MSWEEYTLEEKLLRLVAMVVGIGSVLTFLFLLILPPDTSFGSAPKVARMGSVKHLVRPATDASLKVYAPDWLPYGIGEAAAKKGREDKEPSYQLRLEIPPNARQKDVEILPKEDERGLTVRMPMVTESYFYDYPMVGNCENIAELNCVLEGKTGVFELELDGIYGLKQEFAGSFLYLDFEKPDTFYKKVLVIDAGHGGTDTGAEQGEVKEKDITLAITRYLKALFDKRRPKGLGVYYTRLEDETVSQEQRTSFANKLGANLFLSIHVNSTGSGRMSDISGASARFLSADPTDASKEFAEICLESLLGHLSCESRGLVAGDDIYVLAETDCTSALVEIGFLTNEEELAQLQTKSYQKQAARALYRAIKRMLEEGRIQ